MNRQDRLKVLKNITAQTWYNFCLLEAKYYPVATLTKQKLAEELGIAPATFSKNIKVWTSLGLVKDTQNGLEFVGIDGTESNLTGEVVERKFKTTREILTYWNETYFSKYKENYIINNYGMANSLAKKLLVYSDEELEQGIYTAINLYDRKWASAKYPRPTLGAFVSWLFQQALPYADLKRKVVKEAHDDLLKDFENKGWL